MRSGHLSKVGHKLFFSALIFLEAVACPRPAKAGGVTIITHGFELDGSFPTWVAAMADSIPSYYQARFPGLDTNCATYKLTITNLDDEFYYITPARVNGSPPSDTESGEIIIELDWSALSGDLFDDYASTSNVAFAVTQILLATNSFPELNGRPAIELPIHLVGHSRGGSLVAQISYDLGTNGIWTDHLTTLDPYPINNDGNDDFPALITDAPAEYTYSSVLFADNYWQDLGVGAFLGDPDGEPVAGAYVRQLDELSGGYWNVSSEDAPDHSNVHLWYHGTVDLATPASDTGATITSTERAEWWVRAEERGTNAGFEYSLIGGGNRLSTNEPVGPGFSAIVDGFNQQWDFGAGAVGNRTALSANAGTWPNMIKFDVTGTNFITVGQTVAAKFYYQYAGAFENVTATFYLDGDFNPYNSNGVVMAQISLPKTGLASVYSDTLNLSTTNVAPGLYALYGEISDGTHTRYLYAPELVEIAAPQAPALGNITLNGTQFVITVSGASSEKIIIQASTDLQNWFPIETNTLTSGSWNYTNAIPQESGHEFYRAVVIP
jgi:hypothetical protein